MTQSLNTPETAAFSMEDLLASIGSPVVPQRGAFLPVTVSHASKDGVWLDYGGKTDGFIQSKELEGEVLERGTKLTLQVVNEFDDEGITLFSIRTTRPWRALETARDTAGATVKVHVYQVATNSSRDFAGLRVKFNGVKGFIPRSKCGFGFARAQELLNQELEVLVHEVVPGKDATFNHKPIADAQRVIDEAAREQERTRVREDRAVKRDSHLSAVPLLSVHEAKVTSIATKQDNEFGLFADIAPGVSGLVHHSEIPGLKGKVSENFKRGDVITVAVQKIEEKNGHKQLSLSMRLPALISLQEGSQVTGTVSRTAGFGVFVVLPEHGNVEGLVHTSQIPRGANRKFKVGETITVRVIERNLEQRRLGLSLKGVEAAS